MSNVSRRFPNLAGKSFGVDEILLAELKDAGILSLEEACSLSDYLKDTLRRNSGEVKTWVQGVLHGWSFTRAWYYWVAKGPGIEIAVAEKLHEQWGKQVRVDGHCGCPHPREWYKGLAVGYYHVDTPEGLRALADTIKELVEKNKNHLERLKAEGKLMGSDEDDEAKA